MPGVSPRFVPPDDRVAVFDSDGTLWCEQPASALACFVMDRLKLGVADGAPRVDRDVYRAAEAGDYAFFQALDPRHLSELVLLGSAGLTAEQFIAQAQAVICRVLHPRFGVPSEGDVELAKCLDRSRQRAVPTG
jgi:hypothetical protein